MKQALILLSNILKVSRMLLDGPETDLFPEAWDVTEASTGPELVWPCPAIYRIPGMLVSLESQLFWFCKSPHFRNHRS